MDELNNLFKIDVNSNFYFREQILIFFSKSDAFSKYLECNICLTDLEETYTTKCGHVFCKVIQK